MALAMVDPRGRAVARWAWMAAFAVLVGMLYAGTGRRLVAQWWQDPDYTHGFLVLPLALYFVWERRAVLAGLHPSPSPWGAVLLGLGLAQLVLGVVGAEIFLQRTSFIVVLAGLVLLVLGTEFLKQLLFPLGFLIFMVPLPAIVMNGFAFPLQMLAARTATFCLDTGGIPVLREGNVIVLVNTRLEVAEACSGIRSLQALMCLAAVYGQLSRPSTWQKWALLAASVPIAIAANVFRVTGTGVLAHVVGQEAAEGFYHSFAGWAVFVVALALLVGCAGILARLERRWAPVAVPQAVA